MLQKRKCPVKMLGNAKYYLSQFNMVATLVAKLDSYLALRVKDGVTSLFPIIDIKFCTMVSSVWRGLTVL